MGNNNNAAPAPTIVPSKSSPNKFLLIIPVISVVFLLVLGVAVLNYMKIIALPGLGSELATTNTSEDSQTITTASIPVDPNSEIITHAMISYGFTGVLITDVLLENGVYRFSIISPDTEIKITNVVLSDTAKIAFAGASSTAGTLNDAQNKKVSIGAQYDLRTSGWLATSIVIHSDKQRQQPRQQPPQQQQQPPQQQQPIQ